MEESGMISPEEELYALSFISISRQGLENWEDKSSVFQRLELTGGKKTNLVGESVRPLSDRKLNSWDQDCR